MVEAYEINSTGGQVSAHPIIIIACNPHGDGQPEDGSVQDATRFVREAAQKNINSHQGDGNNTTLPARLPDEEIKSKITEAAAIVCAFNAQTETLGRVNSIGTHVPGAGHSEGSVAHHSSLIEILQAEVWTYLADNLDLGTNIAYKIQLLSGQTCISLSQFEEGVKRIVSTDILRHTDGIAQIKETAFWKCMMNSAPSSTSTESESDPAEAPGKRPSTLNIRPSTFNTFPTYIHKGGRSPLTPDLYRPRTMSNEVPRNMNTFDSGRSFAHDGSETSLSDSAGEEDHGS